MAKPISRVVYALAFACVTLLPSFASELSFPIASARQLLVVTTRDWTATTGTLLRFQRTGERWVRVGRPISVVVGRSGMGWGAGLEPQSRKKEGPVKREGDGRSPAGLFAIGAGFGFDAEKPAWLKLPYLPITSSTECVDDQMSVYYNSVIDRVPTHTAGWNSSEKMSTIPQYRWGVIVNQNAERAPGAGSCVFLHIWSGPADPTAGCTAMQQSDLEEIMGWLDSSAKPLFIALPVSEYERLQHSWDLPPL